MKNYEITEEQIKQLAKGNAKVKEWFPDVFETIIKSGEFWFHSTGCLVLVFGVTKDNGGTVKCKHINNEEHFAFHGIDCMYRKATDSEVLEALKNEAIKRGFKGGAFYIHTGVGIIRQVFGDNFIYNCTKQELSINGFCILEKGKWIAEIIKTYTKEEAEKLLNAKII